MLAGHAVGIAADSSRLCMVWAHGTDMNSHDLDGVTALANKRAWVYRMKIIDALAYCIYLLQL
jgi:hypothetical protein